MRIPVCRPLLAALLLACVWLPVAGAHAAGCVPVLKATLPLTLADHRALVALTIDGAPATMQLDTGAERTLLSETAAKRLGLAAHYTYARMMGGVGGAVSAGEVRPERVGFGGASMPGFFIAVARVNFPPAEGRTVDGLLGADMLVEYDLELDFPHGRARLYAPAACADPLLPWPAGYGGVAAHKSLHRHLFFPVRLDGGEVTAFIDTGARISVLAAAAARRLGVSRAALAGDPPLALRGVAGAATGRLHRFGREAVAGIVWTPTPIAVLKLRLDDADLILGEDFLQTHRVWLSYAGGAVFVAPE